MKTLARITKNTGIAAVFVVVGLLILLPMVDHNDRQIRQILGCYVLIPVAFIVIETVSAVRRWRRNGGQR